MEKEEFFANELNSSSFDNGVHFNELNCSSEQLVSGFFNPNWENSVDQSDPFESALSSMVSSPAVEAPSPGDGLMMRELMGKLGNICESREISRSCVGSNSNSTNTSCYSTPLSSPSKLKFSSMKGNLPIPGNVFPSWGPLPADPGFVERAARFSCLGSKSLGGSNVSYGVSGMESQFGSMTQDGNSGNEKRFVQLTKASRPDNVELGDSREGSSVSEQIPSEDQKMKRKNDVNCKKRKSIPRGKGKETQIAKDGKVDQSENEESNSKKMKQDEESGTKKDGAKVKEETAEDSTEKQQKDDPKPPEPPKDYIHVRARRGQATDPHSLAERARREKISERMKFLQNLVPGCNKVTGKAVMLDEIINYVQSLQRQVEFLSMKLARVSPRTDFNIEALLSKDINHSRGSLANTLYQLGCTEPVMSNGYQPQQLPSLQTGSFSKMDKQVPVNSLNAALCPNLSVALPTVGGFMDSTQVSTFWEDDLQSVVQIGSGPNQVQISQGQMDFEL